MGIAEGMIATKGALEVGRLALELLRFPKIDGEQVRSKLIELQDLILSAQRALGEADDENRQLRRKVEDNERIKELEKLMVFDQTVWWKRTGDGEELEPYPYCTVCWEKDHRLSHLRPGPARGSYFCQIDESSYAADEFTPNPRGIRPSGLKFRT